MPQHVVQWTAPATLWPEALELVSDRAGAAISAPALLRFTRDEFMDELLQLLATDPAKLGEHRAVRETWRGRDTAGFAPAPAFALPLRRLGATRFRAAGTGALAAASPAAARLPLLKLYQPAHQRFYLVSACLVCQTPGLPDRRIDKTRQEQVSFVMRRKLPPPGASPDSDPAGWPEHAWVKRGTAFAWQPLGADDVRQVLPAEERLPLFAAPYDQDDARRRRLLCGLVPVGKREAYLGAGLSAATAAASPQPPGATAKTARKILFRTLVAEPWKQLLDRAAQAAARLAPAAGDGDPPNASQREALLKTEREQLQFGSWLVLLDFAGFLQEHLPTVHALVRGQAPPAPPTPAEEQLVAVLGQTRIRSDAPHDLVTPLRARAAISLVAPTLRDALQRIPAFAASLESTTANYDRERAAASWPDFLFPLADPAVPTGAAVPAGLNLGALTPEEQLELELDPTPATVETPDLVDRLAVLVVRALPAAAAGPEPEIPVAAQTPADGARGVFVVRCVYERPACGPLHDDVVSEATEAFELAGFFDPDAPARPIRIGLPLDTTPAGLRKFNKNTAFVMSDVLCGQVRRLRGMTFGDLVRSVLPFPFHKELSAGGGPPCATSGGASLGTICSLSIPIITLCALILLMIMVTLLDLIFRWVPFFLICFPVPGLKGKR